MIRRKTTAILSDCLMSGMVKSFFILALFFSNTLCFATEKEEMDRLTEITAIAATELKLGWSPSKLVHDTYISIAKKREKKFTIKEANDARPYIEQQVGKQVDMSKCFTQSIVDNYMTAFKKTPENVQLLAEVFVEPMLQTLRSPPETRVATCGLSAFYILNAVVFDIMNQQAVSKNHKSIFTSVVILGTKDVTGDHLAIMVGGSSGMVYLVDPWVNKVVPIQGFSKISGWNSEAQQSLSDITLRFPLPKKGGLNTTINDVFKETDKDVDYYDMTYVKPDTEWELLIPFSKHMRQLIQTNNPKIKELYDILSPAFGWKSYDDIFGNKPLPEIKDKKTE